MTTKLTLSLIASSLLVGISFAHGDDWPQWRGPNRNAVSNESGLLTQWPEGGPKRLWTNDRCGLGYSGFAVVGERLYTMGIEDDKQFVVCLNAIDGTEVWRSPIGADFDNDWGDGPRSTPTVDNGQVFALSADGALSCLNAADGKELWGTKFVDFGGKVPYWGYTESVLVDGDQVVCTPGGDSGSILALNRRTGKKNWQTSDLKIPAQYSSIISTSIDGEKQYVQLLMSAVAGINPVDGKVLWTVDFPGKTAVIPSPIAHENSVYVTAGYGAGCQRIDISGSTATLAWSNKTMKNHHGGVVLINDHIYGYSDGVGWLCQNWNTGESVWSEKDKLGKGAIGYADGRLYCVTEDSGEVALIEPSTEAWKEFGRFKLAPQTSRRKPSGRIWVHPVIANGRLYLRDQEIVYCYDIKK